MYIRVIRVRTQPGRVDELTEQWRAHFVPLLKSVPGFRHAYYGGDRARNAVVVVTLWDDLPRATTYGPILTEFDDRVSGLRAAPSVMDEYEILAEAEAEP